MEAPVGVESPRVLPRFAVLAISLAAVGLALSFVKELAGVIAPVFLALNLAIAAYPIYRKLVAVKVPKAIASIVMGMAVIAVLLAMVTGMSWSIAAMISKLSTYSTQFNNLYDQLTNTIESWGFSPDLLTNQLEGIDAQSVISVISSLASEISGAGVITAVVVTALIFFAMDAPSIAGRLDLAHSLRPGFVSAIESFVAGVRKYWVVTTVFGLIVAALDWVVLLLMGIPLAWVWAIFSFLTNYIPNIGFVIGVVPPVLLALLGQGPVAALVVFVAYAVLNFVIQAVIQPKFTGDAVGVSATVSFVSLLVWTWVLGALGALLALPATLLVKALIIDTDPRAVWINAFISSRPESLKKVAE